MAIKNTDGTPFRVSGSIQQYDPNNTEHDVFNIWDQEIIEMGGSPLYYYDVFINSASIDELYLEARDKIYSNCPVCIYGTYNPTPSSSFIGAFGYDSNQDEIMFEFNYKHVLETLGFMPKVGSRIHSPHRKEDWKVIQRNVEVFKLWGQLRLQVLCERFQESTTTANGRVTEKQPNYQMNKVKDLGG